MWSIEAPPPVFENDDQRHRIELTLLQQQSLPVFFGLRIRTFLPEQHRLVGTHRRGTFVNQFISVARYLQRAQVGSSPWQHNLD